MAPISPVPPPPAVCTTTTTAMPPISHSSVAMDHAYEYMQLLAKYEVARQHNSDGKLAEAEECYRTILRDAPGVGFDEISLALIKHHLGDVLRRSGNLEEAETLLVDALAVRANHDQAAGITIALSDSNLTRDALGKIYEARGDCPRALLVREVGKRICGFENCSALEYDRLHGCSRCKCVFYCGKSCQKDDWSSRHRALCQPVSKVKKDADQP